MGAEVRRKTALEEEKRRKKREAEEKRKAAQLELEKQRLEVEKLAKIPDEPVLDDMFDISNFMTKPKSKKKKSKKKKKKVEFFQEDNASVKSDATVDFQDFFRAKSKSKGRKKKKKVKASLDDLLGL